MFLQSLVMFCPYIAPTSAQAPFDSKASTFPSNEPSMYLIKKRFEKDLNKELSQDITRVYYSLCPYWTYPLHSTYLAPLGP